MAEPLWISLHVFEFVGDPVRLGGQLVVKPSGGRIVARRDPSHEWPTSRFRDFRHALNQAFSDAFAALCWRYKQVIQKPRITTEERFGERAIMGKADQCTIWSDCHNRI